MIRSHSLKSRDCAAGPPGTSKVRRLELLSTMPKPCGPRSKRTVRVSTDASRRSAAFAAAFSAATFSSLSLSSEVACAPPVPSNGEAGDEAGEGGGGGGPGGTASWASVALRRTSIERTPACLACGRRRQ